MADVSVVDSCHGDASLPADTSLAAASETDDNTVEHVHSDDSLAKTQQLVEKPSDADDTAAVPSSDEDSDEGVYLCVNL